jgi:hypothetical protein
MRVKEREEDVVGCDVDEGERKRGRMVRGEEKRYGHAEVTAAR